MLSLCLQNICYSRTVFLSEHEQSVLLPVWMNYQFVHKSEHWILEVSFLSVPVYISYLKLEIHVYLLISGHPNVMGRRNRAAWRVITIYSTSLRMTAFSHSWYMIYVGEVATGSPVDSMDSMDSMIARTVSYTYWTILKIIKTLLLVLNENNCNYNHCSSSLHWNHYVGKILTKMCMHAW